VRDTVDLRNQEAYTRGMPYSTELSNADVINLFLNALRAQKRSPRTVRRYSWLLNRVGEYLHPTDLVAATHHELLAWQGSISHLTAGSIAGYVASLHTFYGWLVRPMRIIDHSPASDLVIPRVSPGKPRPIPEGDFHMALLGCIDDMMRSWLLLGRYAGLRCCEIAWMRRDWILENPTPHLHIQGKGTKERVVFVDASLIEVLHPWMRRQGPVFLRPDGRPFTPENVSDRINRHFVALDLAYTAHQLRHAYGTDALNRTKNIRLVQEQMGHASLASTQVYTQVADADGIALASALGAEVRKHRRR
jgi:site-specific recombinase XerC